MNFYLTLFTMYFTFSCNYYVQMPGSNLFQLILCRCSFVFDDLYFIDLAVIRLVLCKPRFTMSQAAQSRQPCVNSHRLSQWEALGTNHI